MRIAIVGMCCALLGAQEPGFRPDGRVKDPAWFPIGVWLQSPHNAARYRELGINLYVGLYHGPTEAQLAVLEQAGMPVLCAQNEIGLSHEGKAIVGWLQPDEPDNAQKAAIGYGPPIEPWKVVVEYERMRKRDRKRPVVLNLGQGVAWDGWYGRGTRTGHPEDYAEYLKGCDIASFDIYPVTHAKPAVAGRLEFVGNGVRRLRRWSDGHKPIWACIETGHVDNAKARPTPEQIRREVWMAITCGADGIIYFAHEFAPEFVEAGILRRAEIAEAIRRIDTELASMAETLHGPTIENAVEVACAPEADVAVLCKRRGKDLVVFAASMTKSTTRATFTIHARRYRRLVEVLGEDRSIELEKGRFEDDFADYAVHRYVLRRR